MVVLSYAGNCFLIKKIKVLEDLRAMRRHLVDTLLGNTLAFDGQSIAENRYWVPPTDVTIRYSSQAEYVEHYRVLQRKLGKHLTRKEANQEFNKVYALMRLIFKQQFQKRSLFSYK